MDDKTKKDIVELMMDLYLKLIKPDIDRINEKVEAYRAEIIEFKDGLYNRLDKAMGELKTTRDEQFIITQRLDDVEATPTVAHELKKKRTTS